MWDVWSQRERHPRLLGQSEGRESFTQHKKHNEQKNKQDATVCEGTYTGRIFDYIRTVNGYRN